MNHASGSHSSQQGEHTWRRGLNRQCTQCRGAHRPCDSLQPCSRCLSLGIDPTECYYVPPVPRIRRSRDSNTAMSDREHVWRDGLNLSCTECQAQHRRCDSEEYCSNCRIGQVPAQNCYYRPREASKSVEAANSNSPAQSRSLTALGDAGAQVDLGGSSHHKEEPSHLENEPPRGGMTTDTSQFSGARCETAKQGSPGHQNEAQSQSSQGDTIASPLADRTAFPFERTFEDALWSFHNDSP